MTRDEVIEVGAWAYLEILFGDATNEAKMQQRDRDIARAVIDAAEPLIRAQAAADILRAGRSSVPEYCHAARIATEGAWRA